MRSKQTYPSSMDNIPMYTSANPQTSFEEASRRAVAAGRAVAKKNHTPQKNCVRRQSSFGASPQHPSTQPATLALPLLRPSLHIFFAPHNAPQKWKKEEERTSQLFRRPTPKPTSLIAALTFVPKLGNELHHDASLPTRPHYTSKCRHSKVIT
jgi:hypothetical protein